MRHVAGDVGDDGHRRVGDDVKTSHLMDSGVLVTNTMDTRFDKQQHPVRRKHLELEAQQMNRQMDDEATRLASLDQNRTSSCSHA